ncbi:MAG: ribosome-binding factor A [Patescibacteria group bacterium]
MKHRPERVVNLIKEELSKLIARELEFPDSLMTIIDVEIDKKFSRAIVNFSVLPSGKFEQALKILEGNRRHLQYLLMKKINIKPMPEIIFKADRGLEKAAEIEKILIENKIEE